MKILLAYDDAKRANNALRLAIEHAKAFNGFVYVVRSMSTGKDHREIERAQHELEQANAILKEAGVDSETRVLVQAMSAGEDLVNFAIENEIDQIVIGIKKKSRVEKILLGSNAQYVILKAPCPVTTVH